MNKVSIIIPMYQVEDVIEECLLSCMNQTYKNLEILVINDGSLDSSRSKCEQLAKKDSRIIILDKKNGGLSDARNYGKTRCTGEYIFFLDSDDIIHKECIEKQMYYMKHYDVDIVSMQITRQYSALSQNYSRESEFIVADREGSMELILKDNAWGTSACSKLFKKELLSEINFPLGRLYEDLGTIYKVINNSKQNIFVEEHGYFYRLNTDSITTESFHEQHFDLIHYSNEVETFIKIEYPKLERIAVNRKVRCILRTVVSSSKGGYKLNESEIQDYRGYVKKNYKSFLKSEYSFKHKVFSTVYIIFPKVSIRLLEMKK